jgi:hypothetical protein
MWNEEATFQLQPWVRHLGFRNFRELGFRPEIFSIRVSRSDPKLASAAVVVLDAKGRRTPYNAVLLLGHVGRGWEADDPATIFPHSCISAVSRGIRDLMCPDPWTVLGVRHTGLPALAQLAVIRGSWHTIELPGAVCGATHAIKLGWSKFGGDAAVHSAYWPWWPAVEVYATGPFRLPDIDGDGDSDAYFRVSCGNTGGTAGGVLGSADVLFGAVDNVNGDPVKPLRLLGIITPQQPYTFGVPSPYDAQLDVVTRSFNSARLVIVASELWYGTMDPSSCCPPEERPRSGSTPTEGSAR